MAAVFMITSCDHARTYTSASWWAEQQAGRAVAGRGALCCNVLHVGAAPHSPRPMPNARLRKYSETSPFVASGGHDKARHKPQRPTIDQASHCSPCTFMPADAHTVNLHAPMPHIPRAGPRIKSPHVHRFSPRWVLLAGRIEAAPRATPTRHAVLTTVDSVAFIWPKAVTTAALGSCGTSGWSAAAEALGLAT